LQSVVTVRQCQAVQQCHTYLLTYYPRVPGYPISYPVGYPGNELPDNGSPSGCSGGALCLQRATAARLQPPGRQTDGQTDGRTTERVDQHHVMLSTDRKCDFNEFL